MISRTDRKQQTRTEILAAARRVMSRKGFAATTARDVAQEAGVAIGTVFLHFPSMSALAETILDETVGPALEASMKERGNLDLIDGLTRVARRLYDAYDAEPELARQVIAGSLFESSPGSPSRLRMEQFGAWVGGQVTEAVREGRAAAIDPQEAFLTFFALYFGALTAGLRGEMDREGQSAFLRSSLRRLFGAAGGTA